MVPLDSAALGRVLRAGGVPATLADQNADEILATLDRYDINTRNRIGHFLAQLLLESGCLKFRREIWGPTTWQKRYEGNKGLGNTQPGDGKRYMGRGFIQLTGRNNYRAYAQALKGMNVADWDVETNPDAVADGLCADSAGYFWNREKLNAEADRGDDRVNVQRISRAVNRGNPNSPKPALHEDQRLGYFMKVMAALRKEGVA